MQHLPRQFWLYTDTLEDFSKSELLYLGMMGGTSVCWQICCRIVWSTVFIQCLRPAGFSQLLLSLGLTSSASMCRSDFGVISLLYLGNPSLLIGHITACSVRCGLFVVACLSVCVCLSWQWAVLTQIEMLFGVCEFKHSCVRLDTDPAVGSGPFDVILKHVHTCLGS